MRGGSATLAPGRPWRTPPLGAACCGGIAVVAATFGSGSLSGMRPFSITSKDPN